ncbi:helix-turn-helix domain-containing protein [Alistipes indistinctus]|jgi:transcriptional regulator with XRE-family HTH domain|nr:helix-turn-helix transcriptional regulator [Alistipes indistinctus]UWN59548.1 helix-turn-helix transcriptional regulator [Alistipes indistinctus YIT 12060]
MSVKQRLIEFIKREGLSQSRFEKAVGLSNGYVNNISKGIGADKLQRITEKFPYLNAEWLLTGKGEMLKANTIQERTELPINPNVEPINNESMLNRAFDALERRDVEYAKQGERIDRLIALMEIAMGVKQEMIDETVEKKRAM